MLSNEDIIKIRDFFAHLQSSIITCPVLSFGGPGTAFRRGASRKSGERKKPMSSQEKKSEPKGLEEETRWRKFTFSF